MRRFRRTLLPLLAFLSLALPAQVRGAEFRIALLAGHHLGGADLPPLRYTNNDIARMQDVLELSGSFDRKNVVVRLGQDVDAVMHAFSQVRDEIVERKAKGDSTLFLFYYSGHAKDEALRLDQDKLPLADLKRLIDETQADVRIAMLDSCRSGSITRLKGATKGEPTDLTVIAKPTRTGQVLITASSANEDAQESDTIQGSFFTHYLTTALRGAADANQDGNVTLAEAYSFAYAHTVSRTVGTRGGLQHPTYRWDVAGTGDLVLTQTHRNMATLFFPSDLEGLFVVFNRDLGAIVAEFDKQPDKPARITVREGRYAIKKRESDHLRIMEAKTHAGYVTEISLDRMERVAFGDDTAKGSVVTAYEAERGQLRYRLGVGLGTQAFLSGSVRRRLFPTVSVLHLHLDIDNLLAKNLGIRLDLGLGGSGSTTLTLQNQFLGPLQYETQVDQVNLGASLRWRQRIINDLYWGLYGRMGFFRMARSFTDPTIPGQSFATFTPGVGVDIDWQLNNWFGIGLTGQASYLLYHVEQTESLVYVDGLLSATVVWK